MAGIKQVRELNARIAERKVDEANASNKLAEAGDALKTTTKSFTRGELSPEAFDVAFDVYRDAAMKLRQVRAEIVELQEKKKAPATE
jgi:hypothetical protein